MGTFGVLSAHAFGCENTTLYSASQASDLAVDSKGNVWFTDSLEDKVWMCPSNGENGEYGECSTMGTGWNSPHGIAVYYAVDQAATVVYVSEDEEVVKQCMYTPGMPQGGFSCSDFGDGWNSARGLAVDTEGNVFITNAYGVRFGVWKCTPSALCMLVGDSDQWPHYLPDGVAVDSQGNVYVTGGYEDPGESDYVKKCTSTGICSSFGGHRLYNSAYNNAIAVAGDDVVYICDVLSQVLIRCSIDSVCEDVGTFDCGGSNMVIDGHGSFFTANRHGLSRYCLSPSMKDIQI